MNVIIVSFPLVSHIINLPVCSCISVGALTRFHSDSLLCSQSDRAGTHTRTHTGRQVRGHGPVRAPHTHTLTPDGAPRLSVICCGCDNYDQQSHANYETHSLSVSVRRFFLTCFPTMRCKEYQLRGIWRPIRCPCGAKFTPSPHDTVQLKRKLGNITPGLATVSFCSSSYLRR